MSIRSSYANEHAKRYIQAVFEQRLKEEGFICHDDRLLCWYRIVNDTIVNSIIFFSRWRTFPLWLDIAYGIHPLFIEPVFTRNVCLTNRPQDTVRFNEQSIVEDCPINAMSYQTFSEDIQVIAPGVKGRGIYTFDEILLPLMNKIQTVDQAYLFHLQSVCNEESGGARSVYLSPFSSSLIDMSIFLNDIEVIDAAKEIVDQSIDFYSKEKLRIMTQGEKEQNLMHWQQIKRMIRDGNRDDYLSWLKQRASEHRRMIDNCNRQS